MLTSFAPVCSVPTVGLSIIPIPLQAGQTFVFPKLVGGVDCRIPVPPQNLQLVNFSEDVTISKTLWDSPPWDHQNCSTNLSRRCSIKIAIPPESLSTPQRLQLEGESLEVPIDLPYQIAELAIDPANIRDLRSDTTRVKEASKKTGTPITRIDYPVMKRLPGWKVL